MREKDDARNQEERKADEIKIFSPCRDEGKKLNVFFGQGEVTLRTDPNPMIDEGAPK